MTSFTDILEVLSDNPGLHQRSSSMYRFCKDIARGLVEQNFAAEKAEAREFGPFGTLTFPYIRMGAIDSLDLFGLDELIIFAFYHRNRGRYRRVLDIGANLGLHSIILSKCGFEVQAFEPDPTHFKLLGANLQANAAGSVTPRQEAVSLEDGEASFVRVLGNTTGSHLAGSKNSYGELEQFQVRTRAVLPLFAWADFAKIDAEGHEKELLLATTAATMATLDIMVEIGNAENAAAVFDHFRSIGVPMYSQKRGWQQVDDLDGVPTSHREGSLFVSAKAAMPW